MKEITDFCKKWFKANYKNQTEAAIDFKVSRAFISAIKQGKKLPTKEMQSRMGIKITKETVYHLDVLKECGE